MDCAVMRAFAPRHHGHRRHAGRAGARDAVT